MLSGKTYYGYTSREAHKSKARSVCLRRQSSHTLRGFGALFTPMEVDMRPTFLTRLCEILTLQVSCTGRKPVDFVTSGFLDAYGIFQARTRYA